MIEVADILRLHGPAYRQAHRLLPSQQKVLEELVRCRTAACGGQLYRCDHCGQEHYSYHSCRNRHCPKCHRQQTERWLIHHRARLLPCAYYLLTFTLPAPLRALAYAQQKALYGLLLSSAAAALQKLAWDPRYVGGHLAMLAILHTWTRAMLYHPHVHLLVSAGGLAKDPQHWVSARQHAGQGQKVLDYLARYVFRIAITHSRIERFEQGRVTFRYRDNRSQQLQRVNLSAEEFIRRFFLHVLPRGLVKVRSYGLFSAHCAVQLEQARSLLEAQKPDSGPQPSPVLQLSSPNPSDPLPPLCPRCRIGHLVLIASLLPQRTRAP